MNRLKVSLQDSIVALHERGWSRRRIARELGLDRGTVRGYVAQAKPAIPTTGSLQEDAAAKPSISTPGSAVGRQSECAPYMAAIVAALESGLSARRIHQDLVRDHGFAGSYQSVKRSVRRLSARLPLPVRRMESAPGEQMQLDFGQGAWVLVDGGKRRRPHLFRAVLSHSRKGYSEVVWRLDTETFIRCVENAFRHFGGVTRTIVIDNLKAGVLEPDWYDPDLNPKLRDFATHYGTVVLPTQPARPEHKGKVEAGVKYAQNNALKGRHFNSLAEQNLFLEHWERSIADTRIHGTVRKQVGALFAAERPALLPLPVALFPCFVEARRRVHRDGHVEFEKAFYSVPPEYLGREVWVRAETRVLRILNHRMEQIAAHARVQAGRFATSDEHIHAHKRSAVERGADYLLNRCRLIGPNTGAWAAGLHAQRGIYGLRSLQGLLALAKRHSATRIEEAAAIAVHRGVWRLRDLRRLVAEDEKLVQIDFLEEHPLIRDLDAYRISAFSHS